MTRYQIWLKIEYFINIITLGSFFWEIKTLKHWIGWEQFEIPLAKFFPGQLLKMPFHRLKSFLEKYWWTYSSWREWKLTFLEKTTSTEICSINWLVSRPCNLQHTSRFVTLFTLIALLHFECNLFEVKKRWTINQSQLRHF